MPADVFHQFITSTQFETVLALIVLDLVLGVAASLADKGQEFALTYVANFARNDLLGKVFPWFVLYAAGKIAGGTDIVIPGFDLSLLADGAFALVVAALAGSLVTSLGDFGVPLPAALTRNRGSSV